MTNIVVTVIAVLAGTLMCFEGYKLFRLSLGIAGGVAGFILGRLLIGMTNNMERRLYEHKHHLADGFTSKYNINKLVYYETTTDVKTAIAREKQLKSWLRQRKNALVETMNPTWQDLSQDWE